jgi:hypothetical protein
MFRGQHLPKGLHATIYIYKHKTELHAEMEPPNDCNEPFNSCVSVLLLVLHSKFMNECCNIYLHVHTMWFLGHFQQAPCRCPHHPFSYILQASSYLYLTHNLQNTLHANTDCLCQQHHSEQMSEKLVTDSVLSLVHEVIKNHSTSYLHR